MPRQQGATLFITGVTGFVGAALTLDLLRTHKRDRAICLVRGRDPLHARRRVAQALAEAAEAYGVPSAEMPAIIRRVTAMQGDITRPGLGLSETDCDLLSFSGPLTVWHCAASLKDSEDALREIVLHNVTGTQNLLETVLDYEVTCINQVSTAYVCGRKNGVIAETLERPRGFNNRYEQSKYYGEMMIADYATRAGIPYRILRPGIVIGHSKTGRATGYTGFLGWILKLAGLDQISGGALRHQPLRYVAREDAALNVIPVDSVVEDCVGIDAAGATTHNRVFHLTNARPPTIRWLMDVITRTLGLMDVEVVAGEEDLDPISARFHRWTRFERPYTSSLKEFGRPSNRLYPSARHGNCPLDAELVKKMTLLAVEDFRRKQAANEARREDRGVA